MKRWNNEKYLIIIIRSLTDISAYMRPIVAPYVGDKSA